MESTPHAPVQPHVGRDSFPSNVADLLRLATREPGRPRLTWYGDDGERVELSGAVLENWINKTTNLLVEEFDAGPGTRVVIDVPVHWRGVVWALAVWRVGATVVLPAGPHDAPRGPSLGTEVDGAPDVVVSTDPARWSGAAELVAVSLPALARTFDGDLPAGAVDAASAVMTYGDLVGWAPDPAGDEAALRQAGRADLVHRRLLESAVHAAAAAPGARVVVRGDQPAGDALLAVTGLLAQDGSVVLLSARRAAALDTDHEARRRLFESERVTTP